MNPTNHPTPMTPPPPTPDPTPKADSGAGAPATVAELWITDAPDGMAFKCPDCESWATLGGNAAFHMQSKKHRMPKLVKLPAPAPAPEGRGETAECDAAKVDAGYIIASHSNGEFVPLAIAEKLEHERNQWKANHDCQLQRKRKVSAMLSDAIRAHATAVAQAQALRDGMALIKQRPHDFILDGEHSPTCATCIAAAALAASEAGK